MVGGGDAKLAVAAVRVEGGADPDRVTRKLDDRLDLGGKFEGALRRHHAERPAHEQLVVEYVAQAFQRMADGRRRQPERFGHDGELAMPHRLAEHRQQREIELAQFRIVQLGHENVSVYIFFAFISITNRMNGTALKSPIAIVGAGAVGTALQAALADAGHHIVFGVRDAGDAKIRPWLAQYGATSVTTVAQATAQADMLILTVPWTSVGEVLQHADAFAGKIIIDATNPIGMMPGGAGLRFGFETSGGEQVQALAPDALRIQDI